MKVTEYQKDLRCDECGHTAEEHYPSPAVQTESCGECLHCSQFLPPREARPPAPPSVSEALLEVARILAEIKAPLIEQIRVLEARIEVLEDRVLRA